MRHLSFAATALFLELITGCTATSSWSPLVGFHAGSPATFSTAAGVARVVTRDGDASRWRPHSGLDAFTVVEPGWSAGRLSFGLGTESRRGRTATFVNGRASMLRRWRGNTGNYAGIEIEAEAIEEFPLGLRVGAFVPTAPAKGRRPLLFTIDFPAGW